MKAKFVAAVLTTGAILGAAPAQAQSLDLSDNDALTLALSLADNSQDNDGNGNNGNNGNAILADQDLAAVITNNGIDQVIDMDESTRANTGDNSVNNNAYAAFAGIITEAWNTGLNANTQGGTNIGAEGNVNFGGNETPQ
jgi:hypothetical protein